MSLKSMSGEEFTKRTQNGKKHAAAESTAAVPRKPKRDKPPPPEWVPFPLECLPGPACAFVTAAAKELCVDPAYVALPALSVLAASIGNTRAIQPRPGFFQPSVLWSAILGHSGTLKSPSYERATKHLYERQNQWTDEFVEQLKEIEDAEDVLNQVHGKGKPAPDPVLRQIVTTDTTVDALVKIMADSGNAVLIARDELAGWIDSFGKYTRSKELAPWLEFYNGGTWIVNRKSQRMPLRVKSAAVSVTGTLIPEILLRSLTTEYLEAGFGARFCFAWPPSVKQRWKVEPVKESVEIEWNSLLDALLDLQQVVDRDGQARPFVVRLGRDADQVFGEWFESWHEQLESVKNPHLKAAWSKTIGHAARLTLIHHTAAAVWDLRRGIGSTTADVAAESAAAGIRLAEWFAHEATRIYGTENVNSSLIEWIAARGGSTTVRQLTTAKKFHKADQARQALVDLIDAGRGIFSLEGREEIFSLIED